MEDTQKKKRAFRIITEASYSEELYVVIAETFAEAESIYWNELNGYHEIKRIEAIENTKKVGFRVYGDNCQ